MRSVFALAAVLLLAGCSGVYMPLDASLSKDVDPFPANYVQMVKSQVLGSNEIGASVSRPSTINAWEIYAPRGWFVCVRRANVAVAAYAIHHGHLSSTPLDASASLCSGATYEPV